MASRAEAQAAQPDGTWKTRPGDHALQIKSTGSSGGFVRFEVSMASPAGRGQWTHGSGKIGGQAPLDPRAARMGFKPGLLIEVTLHRGATTVGTWRGKYFGGSSPKIVWDNKNEWRLSTRQAIVGLPPDPHLAPDRPMPPPGADSGATWLSGPTIRSLSLPRGEGRCKQACIEDDRCDGVSFDVLNGTCELKQSPGAAKTRDGWTSWRKKGPEAPSPGKASSGALIVGTLLREVDVGDDVRVCMARCTDEAACEASSYNRGARKCRLFSQVTGVTAAHGWSSSTAPAPARPEWGTWGEGMVFLGEDLEVRRDQTRASCEQACEGQTACESISFGDGECRLKKKTGTTMRRGGWVSWIKIPAEFKMGSPLCAQHGKEGRAYRFKSQVGGDRELQLHEEGPLVYEDLADGKRWFEGSWQPFALPDGSVHLHHKWKQGLVLKRRGDTIVADFPDETSSRWFLEYGFEHADFPDLTLAMRAADDGRYLVASGGALGLGDDPRLPNANWKVLTSANALQVGLDPTIPTVVPPQPPIEQESVDLLVSWCVKEHLRRQIPSCYKDSYGRGAGWVSDAICVEKESASCEKNGLLHYPLCKAGYPLCKAGYSGEGPVCWEGCPSAGQTTNCGAMCATSEGRCAAEIVDMVNAVGEVLLTTATSVFTAGSGTAGLSAAKTALKTAGKSAAKIGLRAAMKSGGRALARSLKTNMQRQLRQMVTRKGIKKFLKDQARDVSQRAAQAAKEKAEEVVIDTALAACADKLSLAAAEKAAPELREIAEIIDPTGITTVVNTFDKPTCSETPWPF